VTAVIVQTNEILDDLNKYHHKIKKVKKQYIYEIKFLEFGGEGFLRKF
jgi:hypothetical protein